MCEPRMMMMMTKMKRILFRRLSGTALLPRSSDWESRGGVRRKGRVAVPILGESHIQRCIVRIIVYPKMYLLILLIIIKGISMRNVTKLTSNNILPLLLDLNQQNT